MSAGVPRCYAPSPAGALFAAAGFLAAASDPALRRAAVQELTVDDLGRAAALRVLDSGDDSTPGPSAGGVEDEVGAEDEAASSPVLSPVGFLVLPTSHTGVATRITPGLPGPAPVEVRLAYAFVGDGTSGLVQFTLTMVWSEGDQRVLVSPDGVPFRTSPLPTLIGFVPWGDA
ncbi:MAG: hypothetical protein ACFCVG_00790 [Kineosporiaceae bacterium]